MIFYFKSMDHREDYSLDLDDYKDVKMELSPSDDGSLLPALFLEGNFHVINLPKYYSEFPEVKTMKADGEVADKAKRLKTLKALEVRLDEYLQRRDNEKEIQPSRPSD